MYLRGMLIIAYFPEQRKEVFIMNKQKENLFKLINQINREDIIEYLTIIVRDIINDEKEV